MNKAVIMFRTFEAVMCGSKSLNSFAMAQFPGMEAMTSGIVVPLKDKNLLVPWGNVTGCELQLDLPEKPKK